MSETPTVTPVQAPTVYFIDDSATMREVIKIAFRKENIQVVTCPSVTAAIEQFGAQRPDAVISDVIMPDRDGYELCSYVKGHAELGKTPVILMSGVVNRTVAEKATVVHADELLRKPFQPQELVARVKKLLRGESPEEAGAGESASKPTAGSAPGALSGLSGLFSPPAPPKPAVAAPPPAPRQAAPAAIPAAPPAEMHRPPAAAKPIVPATPAGPQTRPAAAPAAPAAARPAAPAGVALPSDVQRVRLEMQRLELLVKKLQSELEAERQYCQALEAHIRALQGCA
ncbi:MAG TPA: response regulator [Candidatus Acidoferrales bacterium]|nr:response regulator [Candidatus Acidoferrales bacterium]